MKLWLRTQALHNCSWSYVWYELRKALSTYFEIYDDFTNRPALIDISKCIELWWGDPAKWQWHPFSNIKIGYAISEAQSLQSEGRNLAVKHLRKCDMLLCPSEFSARAYKESPIDVDIKIVPLGYNPDNFRYIERDWNKPIKYLLAGAAQYRKGTWLGIEAFLKVLEHKKAILTVWSSTKTPMLSELVSEYENHNQIYFDDAIYDDVNEVYKTHHILLSPHLSEGWGLIIPEAMATGMCCIISRCSTPREYFRKECGYWIEMSELYSPVEKSLINTNGFFRLPDVNDLAHKIQHSYTNIKDCRRKGIFASEYIKSYTWDNTAQQIRNLLS